MSLKRLVALRDVAALLAKTCGPNAQRSYACAATHLSPTQQGSKVACGAASAAVAGLACWLYDTERPAHCLHDVPEPHGSVTEVSAARLQHWLASVGADVEAVEIRTSKHVRLFCLLPCESGLPRLDTLCDCSMQRQAKVFSLLRVFGSLCMSLGGNGHGTAGQSQMMGLSLPVFRCMRLSHRRQYWQTQCSGPHIKSFSVPVGPSLGLCLHCSHLQLAHFSCKG